MPYLLVLLVATASGAAVAAYTIRHGASIRAQPETWTAQYEPPEPASDPVEAPTPAPVDDGVARRRPRADLPSEPTTQTRLTGIVGLLIAVLVGAGAIVVASYALWLALKRAFGG